MYTTEQMNTGGTEVKPFILLSSYYCLHCLYIYYCLYIMSIHNFIPNS